MLRLMGLEELNQLLLEVPGLVDQQEAHAHDLPQQVLGWLGRLEKALASNRLAVVGNVAAVRSEVLASLDGYVAPNTEVHGRMTRRKLIQFAVSKALGQATGLVTGAIEADRGRLAEATRVCEQIVARGLAQGLLPIQGAGASGYEALKAAWKTLAAAPDMKEYTTHVVGLVGRLDALALLDRALTLQNVGP